MKWSPVASARSRFWFLNKKRILFLNKRVHLCRDPVHDVVRNSGKYFRCTYVDGEQLPAGIYGDITACFVAAAAGVSFSAGPVKNYCCPLQSHKNMEKLVWVENVTLLMALA